MRTIAALLIAACASVAVTTPVSAETLSRITTERFASAPAGTTDAIWQQQTPKGHSCPTDRPYQCL